MMMMAVTPVRWLRQGRQDNQQPNQVREAEQAELSPAMQC
jgi:hypothetical protein